MRDDGPLPVPPAGTSPVFAPLASIQTTRSQSAPQTPYAPYLSWASRHIIIRLPRSRAIHVQFMADCRPSLTHLIEGSGERVEALSGLHK